MQVSRRFSMSTNLPVESDPVSWDHRRTVGIVLTMDPIVKMAMADTLQFEVAKHMMMNADMSERVIPCRASWIIFF